MSYAAPRLDGRLAACAGYVRRGAVLADIGTDHGYLPVFLALSGRIKSAVASDINPGPCENASRAVSDASLGDVIKVVCAPGLSGIGAYSPTDIVIAGMGGETIVSILDDDSAAWAKDPDTRFILQPMTRQDHLRRYLASAGFFTERQNLARAGSPRSEGKNNEKIYEIIVCRWDGEKRSVTDTEALLGLARCEAPEALLREHIAGRARQLEKRIEGMSASADPDSAETDRAKTLLNEIKLIGGGYDVPDEG